MATSWTRSPLALLVLACAALAHVPPPVAIYVDVGEQELSFQVAAYTMIVEDWLGLEADKYREFDGSVAEPAGRAVEDFFAEWTAVKIDGVAVKGVVKTIEVVTHEGFDYVQIEVVFGTKALPRQVAIAWRKYDTSNDWHFGTIDAVIAATEAGADFRFTPEEPEFVWHAPREPVLEREAWEPPPVEPQVISLPVASAAFLVLGLALGTGGLVSRRRRRLLLPAAGICLVCVLAFSGVARTEIESPFGPGFSMPSEEEALLIFESLQRNIYRAFDYERESDVYDTLARSVKGELLDEVYTEVLSSLILEEQGGAVARVLSTKVLEASVELPDDEDSRHFKVDCRWRVHGIVRHWGHTHRRVNEHRAVYTVSHGEEGWRIADLQVLELERVDEPEPDGSMGVGEWK